MDARLAHRIDWLRRVAHDARELLVPVSGGSDSALCFWLCASAWPEKTTGIFFGDELRGQAWLASLGRVEMHSPPQGSPKEREVRRWLRLLEMSLARSAWLVGSRNRTEDVLGTYSMASRVVGCLPLAGLWKSEVMALCAAIGVPEEVLASSRRADPNCGRSPDLAEIGLELIDVYLSVCEGERSEQELSQLTPAQVRYLDHVRGQNSFKRTLPTRP